MGGGTGSLSRVRDDLLWAAGLIGLADLRRPRASALIGFDRVRPARRGAFQPQRHLDVTPERLDQVIRALMRWRVDIVSIDEAGARLADPAPHRFVSLSFNGSYGDVLTHGWPVLARHGVPFTVYVPSAFPDGIAEPWWLALEAAIAPHDRISLVIDRKERHFAVADAAAKVELYDFLSCWMRGLPPADRTQAINDLCTRYGADMAAMARDAAITWNDLARLAADPQVTIGSATVNYPVLSSMTDAAAQRDIAMGRAVLEAALQRPVPHFAFPFGDERSFDHRHVEMAREAGFASAVSAMSGVLGRDTANLHDLPRLIWTDRMTIRGLRLRLAGY